MRRLFMVPVLGPVILAVSLAGCAGFGGPAVPVAATLSAETLTVDLSDGTTCRAEWVAAGGAGRLDDCGAGFDYRVTEVAKPNLLRQLFEGITGALGAEGVLAPMAVVEIAGAGRDWRFVSPPPLDDERRRDGLTSN